MLMCVLAWVYHGMICCQKYGDTLNGMYLLFITHMDTALPKRRMSSTCCEMDLYNYHSLQLGWQNEFKPYGGVQDRSVSSNFYIVFVGREQGGIDDVGALCCPGHLGTWLDGYIKFIYYDEIIVGRWIVWCHGCN